MPPATEFSAHRSVCVCVQNLKLQMASTSDDFHLNWIFYRWISVKCCNICRNVSASFIPIRCLLVFTHYSQSKEFHAESESQAASCAHQCNWLFAQLFRLHHMPLTFDCLNWKFRIFRLKQQTKKPDLDRCKATNILIFTHWTFYGNVFRFTFGQCFVYSSFSLICFHYFDLFAHFWNGMGLFNRNLW